MTMLVQATTGVALALSVGLLATQRTTTAAALCAIQALTAAAAAAATVPLAAAVQLAFAAALGFAAWRLPVTLSPVPRATLPAAAALALLAMLLHGDGIALAVVLLGGLMLATRRSTMFCIIGLASMQNGVVLALPHGVPAEAAAVVPLAPAIAAGGLWLALRRPVAAQRNPGRASAWLDPFACIGVLLLSLAIVGLAPITRPPLALNDRAALMLLLVAIVAATTAWDERQNAGRAVPAGARTVLLLAAAAAIALPPGLPAWCALACATAAASWATAQPRPEAWRRSCFGCLGLLLVLLGIVAAHASDVWAGACIAAGIGAIGWLAPELALTGAAFILLGRGFSALQVPLIAAGFAAMAVAGCSLASRVSDNRSLAVAVFGQAGVAVFAWGIGTPEAHAAALLHLTLLALAASTMLLARSSGLGRAAGIAGLAGIAPVGVFPSLALIVSATAARNPWLLPVLLAGLGLLCLPLLARLRLSSSAELAIPRLAWLPLLLLLAAGFAMPHPIYAWVRAAGLGPP